MARANHALLGWCGAGAVVVLYLWMALSASTQHSDTYDESLHISAGYSYWTTANYRLHPENGILPQRWIGLSLITKKWNFPPPDSAGWKDANAVALGPEFLYEHGNDARAILLRARASIALLTAALLVVVYLWSRKLFGRAGGMISLLLAAFCPTMLSHGALATSDACASLMFLLAVGAMWRAMQRVSPWSVAISALAVAGVLLAKFSGGLVVLMAAPMLVARLQWGGPLQVNLGRRSRVVTGQWQQGGLLLLAGLAHIPLVLTLIWGAYGFRYSASIGAQDVLRWDLQTLDSPAAGAAIGFARRHHLLPEAYLYGLTHTLTHASSRYCFLNGEHGTQGWPEFFPYCLAVKTPLGVFGALAMALAAAVAIRRARSGLLYRTVPLASLLGVYWLTAVMSHLNIGFRHVMPTLAPMYILAGAAAYWLTSGPLPRRIGAGVLCASLVLWTILQSLAIRPHYLAYFNELVGGPRNGWRHLVDSSLDWGQDLPSLRRWLDEHQLNRPDSTFLTYFGLASPEYYGIRAAQSPQHAFADLHPGTYCVSATMLQAVYLPVHGPWCERFEFAYQRLRAQAAREPLKPADDLQYRSLRQARLFAALRQRSPDDMVGYSILIYHVGRDELDLALNGPPPELRANPAAYMPGG